ncbi:MAG: phosphomannomutase/phosphoglucomutase, partial [Thermoanaerobaculia bacterium]
MAGIFKAYDVRGLYPAEIDEAVAEKIGRAFQHLLDSEDRARGNAVVVSRDMRSHSAPLQAALVEGLLASGLDIVDIGLATTPMNYFAVGHLRAAGGIQVTASHNPERYNGFKLSRHEARPVSGDHGIPRLERAVATGDLPAAERPGRRTRTEVFAAYGEHVLAHLHPRNGGRRLRLVADAGNGMGTLYQPLLEQAGLELVPLYFELDGRFPNHEANPLKLENLEDACAKVRETSADLGIAFDGDADRAAFIDERGEPVGSDLATALIAGELLARQPGRAVIYDLRSSRAVAEYVRERGGVPVRERVGHSFIKATLRERDGIFGGELAGHYYFRDNYFADCALMAVVEIVNLLRAADRPLSELVRPLERYAKLAETNFEVEDKQGMIDALARRYAGGAVDFLDGVTVEYPD